MAAASADDSQTNLETSLADDRDDAPPVASTSAAASLPAAPVQSAAEDAKLEMAANPLAAISNDLIVSLRNAIQVLQAMQKIVVAKA